MKNVALLTLITIVQLFCLVGCASLNNIDTVDRDVSNIELVIDGVRHSFKTANEFIKFMQSNNEKDKETIKELKQQLEAVNTHTEEVKAQLALVDNSITNIEQTLNDIPQSEDILGVIDDWEKYTVDLENQIKDLKEKLKQAKEVI